MWPFDAKNYGAADNAQERPHALFLGLGGNRLVLDSSAMPCGLAQNSSDITSGFEFANAISAPREPLADKHNRVAFSCGVEALDRYLQRQAGQDVTKHLTAAFIITPDGEAIAGFYTLSAHVLNLGDLPDNVAKKLPRYPNVPATLLCRLAVSIDFRGRDIGELLLLDAFKRVLANTQEVGSAVLVVEAKDERAREFYLRHDFIPLPSQSNRFFYTVKTIEKLFESKQGRKRD